MQSSRFFRQDTGAKCPHTTWIVVSLAVIRSTSLFLSTTRNPFLQAEPKRSDCDSDNVSRALINETCGTISRIRLTAMEDCLSYAAICRGRRRSVSNLRNSSVHRRDATRLLVPRLRIEEFLTGI